MLRLPLPTTFALVAAGCAVVAVVPFRADRSARSRIMVVFATTLLCASFWLSAMRCFEATRRGWDINRLAVPVSWLKGYALYYPPDLGPITNHVYGPVAVMAFVPASALAIAVR